MAYDDNLSSQNQTPPENPTTVESICSNHLSLLIQALTEALPDTPIDLIKLNVLPSELPETELLDFLGITHHEQQRKNQRSGSIAKLGSTGQSIELLSLVAGEHINGMQKTVWIFYTTQDEVFIWNGNDASRILAIITTTDNQPFGKNFHLIKQPPFGNIPYFAALQLSDTLKQERLAAQLRNMAIQITAIFGNQNLDPIAFLKQIIPQPHVRGQRQNN